MGSLQQAPLHRASAAFFFMFMGTLFRRGLVVLGRVHPAPSWLLGLEVLALLGGLTSPGKGWGHGLIGLATFIVTVTPRSGSARATRWERLVPGVLGASLAALALVRSDRQASLALVLALLVSLESFWPWSDPFVTGIASRVAGLSLAGAALIINRDGGPPGAAVLDLPIAVLVASAGLVVSATALGGVLAALARSRERLLLGCGLVWLSVVESGGNPSPRNMTAGFVALLVLEALARLKPWEPGAAASTWSGEPWGAMAWMLGAFAPTPWLRAVLLGAALTWTLTRARSVTLAPETVARLATTFFAFGVAPLALFRHASAHGRILDVALTLGAAIVWAWAVRRPVLSSTTGSEPWTALVVVGAGLALSLGPLGAALLWRGDESAHLARLSMVLDIGREGGAVFLGAVALAFALRRAGVGSWVLHPTIVLGVLGTVLAAQPSPGLNRYLLLEAWGQGVLATSPGTFKVPALHYAEGWGRLLPLLGFLGGAVTLATRTPLPDARRLLVALLFVTLPAVRDYAAICYLELPLIALMLLVLLSRASGATTSAGAFLALLAIPYLKETAVPFVGAVWLHALWACRGASWRELARESLVYVLPIGVTVYLRPPGVRDYSPRLAQLFEPRLYTTLARFSFEELGALPILAVAGILFAWRRGRRDLALLCGALVVGYPAFFAMDGGQAVPPDGEGLLPLYWGLPRFMLLVVPAAFVLAVETVAACSGSMAMTAFLVAGLAVNLLLSPVDLQGRRAPFWGDAVYSSSEFAYPYDRAIRLATQGDTGVTLVGLCYPYDAHFYLWRAGARGPVHLPPFPESHLQKAFRDFRTKGRVDPGESVAALRSQVLIERAARPEAGVIIQLVPGDLTSVWPESLTGLSLRGDLRWGECRLIVYGPARSGR